MHVGGNNSLYRAARYVGEWKEKLKHGVGELFYLDGSSLEGDFAKGHAHGNIVKRYPEPKDGSRRVQRVGVFVRGECVEWLEYTEEEAEVASDIAMSMFGNMEQKKEDAELEELGLWGENKIPEFTE